MLTKSLKALAAGRSVLVFFRKGTRKWTRSEPIVSKRGVGSLNCIPKSWGYPVATRLGVNAGKFWGAGSGSSKRGGAITVSYLPPIPPGMSSALFSSAKAETQDGAERSTLPTCRIRWCVLWK